MIHSLFIVNNSGDIFVEKHWRSVIHRSICDYFFEVESKATNNEDILPVIQTPHHYLINIYRNQIFFIAVCMSEVPPLFVIEFLHRVVDILEDYFTDANESIIKDNIVRVYEILDEMLDNGFPLATESNILKELIKPANLLRSFTDTVTGKYTSVSDSLPTGTLSSMPWRRAGVKYTNNEAYFDVIEEIDCIIDRSGSIVCAEIQGYIDCLVKLSGMPDLTMIFVNPRLLDDVSFHPCIRFKRWENERVLSFIPPDGNFRLISYHVGNNTQVALPVYVRHSINFFESGSRLDVTVGPKSNSLKPVEQLTLEIHMPKAVLNVSLNVTVGRYTFDPVTKILLWDVGKLDPQKPANIKGGITLQSGASVPDFNPLIHVNFSISQFTVSGLRVNRVEINAEEKSSTLFHSEQSKYKPYKGVKYVTKAGRFQVRT